MDGMEFWTSQGETTKVSGIYRMLGRDQSKLSSAKAGDTVALGKLDAARTGQTLTSAKGGMAGLVDLRPPQPVFSFSRSVRLRPSHRGMGHIAGLPSHPSGIAP